MQATHAVELAFDDLTLEELDAASLLIGRFIVTMSGLDLAMSQLVVALFHLQPQNLSEALAHGIDISRKRELLTTLAKAAPQVPIVVELRKLLKKVERLTSNRNVAAHGLLIRHPSGKPCLLGHSLSPRLKWVTSTIKGDSPDALFVEDLPRKIDEAALIVSSILDLHRRVPEQFW